LILSHPASVTLHPVTVAFLSCICHTSSCNRRILKLKMSHIIL